MVSLLVSQRRPAGFTLLEIVVVIGIIGLIATVALAGWPRVRERQAITLAEQQLQSLLRQTQQQAFHEERSPDCLARYEADDPDQSRCSDTGLALKERDLLLFADTAGSDKRYGSGDFVISRHTLPAGVTTPYIVDWHSFVFNSVPPDIYIFNASGIPIRPRAAPELARGTIFLISNRNTHQLEITPYGQLQPQR